MLFARYPAVVNSFFTVNSYPWDPTASLNNAGEQIALSNSLDMVIDSLTYGIALPWDSTANGHGHSLVLCNETSDEHIASNWSAALNFQGMYFGGTTTDSVFANPGVGCTTVGVEEVTQKKNLVVYPNPSQNDLFVSFVSQSNEQTNFSVLDLAGRTLSRNSEMIHSGLNSVHINTSNLEQGTYFISFVHNSELSAIRFVKN
jgi:hypothetical protein